MHVTWWNIEGNEGTTNITIKNVNEKVFFSSSIAAEIAKSRMKNDTNGAYIRWRERKKKPKERLEMLYTYFALRCFLSDRISFFGVSK